jgi:hypothetical protein
MKNPNEEKEAYQGIILIGIFELLALFISCHKLVYFITTIFNKVNNIK